MRCAADLTHASTVRHGSRARRAAVAQTLTPCSSPPAYESQGLVDKITVVRGWR